MVKKVEVLVYMEVIFKVNLQSLQVNKKQNEKIIQSWKMADWQNESEVCIKFIEYKDEQNCQMVLNQKNIPDNVNIENLKKGWMGQIFDPIRIIMGFPILQN